MKKLILYIMVWLPVALSAQTSNLSGYISTVDGSFVENVEARLFDDQGQLIATTLTQNGRYTFNNLPSGYEYTLQLDKGGSPVNGVSTFDYVMVSRHLLGIEPLSEAYQLEAADVDGSGTISISDMLYIRQLVLGLHDKFPHQRNWMFKPQDTVTTLSQQGNTFSFVLTQNLESKSFTIFKIGDLNRTAIYD